MTFYLNLNNISQVEKNAVEGLIIKAYSMKELKQLYQVSHKTLVKWLQPFSKEIGKRNGHFYSVSQVETIFLKLGMPHVIKNDRGE